jgi:hypothetical protein
MRRMNNGAGRRRGGFPRPGAIKRNAPLSLPEKICFSFRAARLPDIFPPVFRLFLDAPKRPSVMW